MKRLLSVMALLVLLGAILLSGCSGESTTTQAAAQTSTTQANTQTSTAAQTSDKYGGTLKFIYPFSPTSTPGWPADSVNFQRGWMGFVCFEHLVNLDKSGAPIPHLATDWEWSSDFKNITFTLRDGVRFHDGTKFTSEAVKMEADLVMESQQSNAINWESWEVIDDLHIRLNLKKYQNNFWEGMVNNNMMFASPTAYKEHGQEWMMENPIGTGPFKFASFEKDVALKFVRNDDYWQAGKPYLDAIEMITVKETLTAESLFQSGGGDIWVCQVGKVMSDMKGKGFVIAPDTGGVDMLVFDTMNEGSVFNDIRVRQAVEYAIDKQAIVDTLSYGYSDVTYQITSPQNYAFNPNIGTRAYDPEKAKALLAEAGYPNGIKNKITTMGTSNISQSLQQYLFDVGIDVALEPVDNAKFFDFLRTGWNESMLLCGYAVGPNIPSWFQSYFPPTPMATASCRIPDEIVAKFEPAITEPDPVKAKQLSDEILQMIFDDATMIPLSASYQGSILSTRVHDSGINDFFDFWKWTPADCWVSE